MSRELHKIYYSGGIILTLAAQAFFFVYFFGIFVGPDEGKTIFLATFAAFLVIFGTLGAMQLAPTILRAPTQSFSALKKSLLFSVGLSMVPYASVCLFSEGSTKQLIYLALIFFLMYFASAFKLDRPFLSKLSLILFLAATIHLLLFPTLGFPKYYSSLFAQKNMFAINMLVVFFSAYLTLKMSDERNVKALSLGTMTICFVLILCSRSRGVLLDLLVFLFLRATWQWISANRVIYWTVFCGTIAAVVILIPAYVALSYTTVGIQLNAIVHEYTGVQLFSGRNIIWPAYLYFITLKPLLGYGFGNQIANMMVMFGLPSDVLGLSAHNLYLMVASQTGLLGLAALILFFGTVWATLYRNRSTLIGSIACAVFLTGLVNEMFEVTLTQTNLDVMVFFWFLVALGFREDHDTLVDLPVWDSQRWNINSPLVKPKSA